MGWLVFIAIVVTAIQLKLSISGVSIWPHKMLFKPLQPSPTGGPAPPVLSTILITAGILPGAAVHLAVLIHPGLTLTISTPR